MKTRTRHIFATQRRAGLAALLALGLFATLALGFPLRGHAASISIGSAGFDTNAQDNSGTDGWAWNGADTLTLAPGDDPYVLNGDPTNPLITSWQLAVNGGSGTVTVDGSNQDYATLHVSVPAGVTLALQNFASIATDVTVADGGTLVVTPTDYANMAFSGALHGGGTVQVASTNGLLQLKGSLAGFTGSLQLVGNLWVEPPAGGTTTPATIQGNGLFYKAGTESLTLTGDISGLYRDSAATLMLFSSGPLIIDTGADSRTLNAGIEGTGTLQKTGSGTLTLNGVADSGSTYTVQVDAGTLVAGNAGVFAVSDGGTIVMGANTTLRVTQASTGFRVLGGASPYTLEFVYPGTLSMPSSGTRSFTLPTGSAVLASGFPAGADQLLVNGRTLQLTSDLLAAMLSTANPSYATAALSLGNNDRQLLLSLADPVAPPPPAPTPPPDTTNDTIADTTPTPSPQTGDNSSLVLWAALGAVALCGLGAMALLARRARRGR